MSVCLLFTSMSSKCEVMGSILELSYLRALSFYMCINKMYFEICRCLRGCCLDVKNIVYEHECILSHLKGVCKISDTYLLGCWRYVLGRNIAIVFVVYKHVIEI